ncbi:unnamed protein product [Discosporangium mesarthrocarpum]
MFGDPKFPVVDPTPSSGKVVSNFSIGDIATFVGVTAGSAAFCFTGVKGLRGPNAVAGAIIGGMGGFLLAYQNSYGRLTGHKAP